MNLKKIRNCSLSYACILTTGRTGSDYLQGCLDGVPGVITFSGEVPFLKFLNNSKTKSIIKTENSKKFIEHFVHLNKNLFFYDKLENKKFKFSVKNFKFFFILLMENQKFNYKNLINSIYLSYHKTLKRRILKKNLILHHSHNLVETESFIRNFKNSKLLVTIRNPFQNLKSGISNWARYDKSKKNFEHFYLYINRIREDLNYALNKKKVFFVKLENMNSLTFKKSILSFLNLKNSMAVNTSTFAGIPWKSDRISQFKKRNGKFNTSVLQENWKDFYFKKDLIILRHLYSKYNLFGYQINKLNIIEKASLPLLFLLPMKFELKVLKTIFFTISIKKISFNIYFFLRKIIYYYKTYFVG